MKPAPFAYHSPRTLPETIELLSLENSKLLAGGQSLVPMLNMRFAVPSHVIDLNRVTGLSGIRRDGNIIEIGAMTRQCDLEASSIIAEALPILSEALPHIGHFQTRSRGTIGGSLCHLDTSAELPALCLLMDAELTVSGPKGSRTIPAGQWFEGFMQPTLAQDAVLTSIRIPAWEKSHGYGFCEFSRRHGDFAIAGAAALLNLDSSARVSRAAITVFGLEVSPRRLLEVEKALVGVDASQATFAEAAEAVIRLDAMDDATASAKYRSKLGVSLVKRALDLARQRAKASGA